MLTSLSIYSDYFKIAFQSLSNEKKCDEPSFKATKQTLPLSVSLYNEKNLQQIIKTVLESQSSVIIISAFNKTCERLLKTKASEVY